VGPFDETKQPLPEAAKANILRKYGLDRPVWEQYLRYMWAAVHLDFGIRSRGPTETVTELIARVWPNTLRLAGVVISSPTLWGSRWALLPPLTRKPGSIAS